MQCPVDGTTLAMADRQGVEVDYCPQCRGIWLDRGELDKLLERVNREDDDRVRDSDRDRERDRDWERERGSYGHQSHKKKKKNWLSEVFEFE